jgi:hypothetical protein
MASVGVGLAAVLSLAAFVSGAEQAVKPLGAYPVLVPSTVGTAKVHLWCSGVDLLGLVVTGDGSCASAMLVQDGRCESKDTRLSFGFLVSREAWTSEPPAHVLKKQKLRYLYRFEGATRKGKLDGVLQQVDLNHPGESFQRFRISSDTLPQALGSFDDPSEWRRSIDGDFQVIEPDP